MSLITALFQTAVIKLAGGSDQPDPLTVQFDEQQKRFDALSTRLAADRDRKRARINAATRYMQPKLAEVGQKHCQMIAAIDPASPDAHRLMNQADQTKLAGQRAIITRTDGHWGEDITNQALRALNFNDFDLRRWINHMAR